MGTDGVSSPLVSSGERRIQRRATSRLGAHSDSQQASIMLAHTGWQFFGTSGRMESFITPWKICDICKPEYGVSPSCQISHSTMPNENTSTCASVC